MSLESAPIDSSNTLTPLDSSPTLISSGRESELLDASKTKKKNKSVFHRVKGFFKKNTENAECNDNSILKSKPISIISNKLSSVLNKINSCLSFKKNTEGNIENTSDVAEISEKSFSEQEVKALQTLSKAISFGPENKRITNDEINQIIELYNKALTDKQFQKKLNYIFQKNIEIPGVFSQAIEKVHAFADQRENAKGFIKLQKLQKKLKLLHEMHNEKRNNPSDSKFTIDEKEKMTITEFGILERKYKPFKKMKDDSFISALLKRETLSSQDKSNLFLDLSKSVKNTGELFESLENELQQELHDTDLYQSGDIIAADHKKASQYSGDSFNLEGFLHETFITKIGHLAKIYRTTDENNPERSKTMVSHVTNDYLKDNIRLCEIAASKVWRLDLSKLIDRENPKYQALENYCKNQVPPISIDEFVQQKFHESENKIHEKLKRKEKIINENNEQQTKFRNPSKRRKEAGLADFGLAGGHKREQERSDNFRKVHEKFMRGFKPPHQDDQEQVRQEQIHMICSEFVTKATIAALIETSDFIEQILANETELSAQPNDAPDAPLLQLPFETTERLKRVHPGRLIEILQTKNCIKLVKPPKIVQDLFQQ